MHGQNKVTAVILAGGLARRMDRQDKGLIEYNGRPMVSYAFETMSQVAETVIINANRNMQAYRQFGCEVISDQTHSFDGPLAGILAAMNHATTDILLVIPCDSPLIKPCHIEKLLTALTEKEVDITVAFDGERLHPVLLALKTSLQDSLADYLQLGERKIDKWLNQHALYKVDFSQEADIFLNINTLAELQALQKKEND